MHSNVESGNYNLRPLFSNTEGFSKAVFSKSCLFLVFFPVRDFFFLVESCKFFNADTTAICSGNCTLIEIEGIFSLVLEQSEFHFSELKNDKIYTAGMLDTKKSKK